MPLVSLDQVSIAYGQLPLLEDATLRLEPGERVCVIGRNGTGKSTLLKILAGTLPPDRGVVRREPGVRTAMLVQDVPLSSDRPVFDVVAGGLGELSELAAAYHHTAVEVAAHPAPALLDTLGRLQQTLEARDGWRLEQQVELVVERLRLPSDAVVDTLSGGWRRRVLMARALVAEPDVLLLDEPTNHLDIDAIGWLETFLTDYPGTVVVVTHDRVFLQRVATRIVELDRGRETTPTIGGGRRSGWPMKPYARPNRTSGWRSKKCGCAGGSRLGAPETRGASRRCLRCGRNGPPDTPVWAACGCGRSVRPLRVAWCSKRTGCSCRSMAHRSFVISRPVSCEVIGSG